MVKEEMFFNGCLFTIFIFLSFATFFGDLVIGNFSFGDTEFKRYGFSILFLLLSILHLYALLKD